MMDQNAGAHGYSEEKDTQGIEALGDSQKLMGREQDQSFTTSSDGTHETCMYQDNFLYETGESTGKRKGRSSDFETLGGRLTEGAEKAMRTNKKKERMTEPTSHVRHGDSQLQQVFFKPDAKIQDDARTLMVAKAQHEVTSLSPKERNRILESIHGIVHEEEVDHGGNETEFAFRAFSEILPQAGATCESVKVPALGPPKHEGNKESGHGDAHNTREEYIKELAMQRDVAYEQRFIQRKLEELDEALRQMHQKVAYDQAVEDLVEYVEDPKFRLIFLRADSYDGRKAAARLVAFLDEKLKRFGPDALTRQLTIDDLSGSAKSLLAKKGVFQVLPTRDSSDRAILVAHYQASKLRFELRQDPSSLGDAIFYLLSAMAEDDATQRRGIVTLCVISATPQPEKRDVDVILHAALEDICANIYDWCPLKCNAHHHWVYDNNTVVPQFDGKHNPVPVAATLPGRGTNTAPTNLPTALRSGAAVFETIGGCFGKDYRIRTRLHEGNFEDYKGVLKTFGIPAEHLPFSIDGSEIRVSGSHVKWLQKRRQKEAVLILHRQSMLRARNLNISMMGSTDVEHNQGEIGTMGLVPSCFDVIDIPGRHDVCLGRGTTLHQHAGNVAMRAMMEPLVDEYENATSTRRQDLNKVIVQAVHVIGGKFLTNKSNDGAWFEVVTDMAIVEKSIGGIFRSMVSRVNANKKSNWAPIPGSSS